MAHEEAADASAVKVPNSPSTAFAALSLHDLPSSSSSSSPSTSSSIFTPTHLQELESATSLVASLDLARKAPKPLIRSTGHIVPRNTSQSDASTASHHHLLSWKVSEFAYRKSTSVGSELPTLARGLFTERLDSSPEKHRIVIRGYDKFFNLGEMAWTKPESISLYTKPPYVLTFKENGCIIFISALSPTQIVVTSKHSLGSIEGTEVTHAQKGHEWLLKHLASVQRSEEELAAELWRRNETAAFELCDDSFEEHVLAYSDARSGLHLHGLNANSAQFRTRSMPQVDAFAKEWGFIPTRWLQLDSLQEVQRVTGEIEQTGAWEGEPIEGFVIRTHMPEAEAMDQLAQQKAVSPPYAPGQAWFYKVKFDEPYLMYRDWRELARKMVKEKAEWEAKVAALPASLTVQTPAATTQPVSTETESPAVTDLPESAAAESQAPSKAALKRARKRQAKQTAAAAAAELSAARAAGLLPPPPPQPRSKRPETLLFIQWCYDRLYGTTSVKAQPHLFAGLTQNKGIIAMRNAFLSHLSSHQPASSSSNRSGGEQEQQEEGEEEDTRPFTKTILCPIAVPGCGKTMLALALSTLFGVGHVQSDDYKKKTGFLSAIEKDLRAHASQVEPPYVVFADKNNHLLQHRDDLVDLAARLSDPKSGAPAGKKAKPVPAIGRIRTVALAFDLDTLPLNTLHRICAARIEARGDNHQTLVADTTAAAVSGMKSHETVLWKFLEALQPFASGGKGEGSEGYGDARFDQVIRLGVADSIESNLKRIVQGLGWTLPDEQRMQDALRTAKRWKVAKKSCSASASEQHKGEPAAAAATVAAPRYFGLAVELDVRRLLDSLLVSGAESDGSDEESIQAFYTTMRRTNRLTQRPHITLVHHSNLSTVTSTDSTTTTAGNIHDQRWAFYSRLLANKEEPPQPQTEGDGAESVDAHAGSSSVFRVTLRHVLYERSTLLTLVVDDVDPPAAIRSDFHRLHYPPPADDDANTPRWTPHITLATRPDVAPYEANRVVSTWLSAASHPPPHHHQASVTPHTAPHPSIHVLTLPTPLTVEARVFGMS